MNRRFRLTRSTNFERVRRFGKSYAHPLIVLIAFPTQAEVSRFGVAAGRSVGKAVRRNRVKRLLRSALQQHLPVIKPGWDVVLIARRTMVGATFDQTVTALAVLLGRAGLLKEVNDFNTQKPG